MEEAAGATRVDSVGANNLTDHGTVGQGTGKILNGGTFNGSSQYLTITDNAAVSMGDVDCTWMWWVKFTSVSGYQRFFSKDNGSTNREWILGYEAAPNNKFFVIIWGGASGGSFKQVYATTFGAPTTSTWYQVIGSHDATANTVGLCVNAGTFDSTAVTTGIYDGTADLWVGGQQGVSQLMAGTLDEGAIWKRVLTSTERTALYNNGYGLAYPFLDPSKTIFTPQAVNRSSTF